MASGNRGQARIKGLDGLRALAVFLVLGYHLLIGVCDSGFIGVDVFFVISGFLITTLLLREKETTGKIDIRAFWARRIRRLVPAVVVATLSVVALARIVGGDSAVQLRWQGLGAVTGTYNWLELAFHSSYFEKQSPLLLTNMWSLAVEQQFYLLWPLLLLLIMLLAAPRLRPWLALFLAAASFIANVIVTGNSEDVTRAYVGTDTHSFGLMIGAALALSLPGLLTNAREPLTVKQARRRAVVGWIGLVAIIALAVFVPDAPQFYPWVMLGASLTSALLIRAMLPDMGAGKSATALWVIFDSRLMRWIGERSYGIYLWHWPLWVISYYTLSRSLSVVAIAVIVTTLSVVLAHLSYVFIETPIRREGFFAFMRHRFSPLRHPERIIVATMPVLLFTSVTVWAFASSPEKNSAQVFVENGQKLPEDSHSSAPSGSPEPLRPSRGAPKLFPNISDIIPMPTGDQISLIGDSVTLGSSGAIQEKIPGIYIDAVVSRNIIQVPDIIDGLLTQGTLREYVIVSVSANSTITEDDIEGLLKQIGKKRRLVLVTGYGPEQCTWIPPTNATIREVAKKHPRQIRVADWATIAENNQDLLAEDRVHPNPYMGGTDLFADELVRTLDSF